MQWKSYPDESNIEEIKKIVERYFTVYESKQEENIFAFFIKLPLQEEMIQQNFDSLLKELKEKNLIPFLRERDGEHVIFVAYKPKVKGKPKWVNILLFVTTVITTMLSGAILFKGEGSWWSILSFEKLLNGLIFFSLPLLSILGIHELRHYFVSKKHGIASSLPFFIPIPPNPVLPLGTMGAVISMREPIPDRKALLDIGIAGPLAGFLVAIPVLLIGLKLSSLISVEEIPKGTPLLGEPLLFSIISSLAVHVEPGYVINLHPTAFAGWVGLLVTAINLLPAGQLDGGHIARAVLKEKHRYASFATVILLASLSFIGMGNWLFFLLLLVFLIGTEHPPPLNEFTPLDGKRKLLALIALLIFILSFTPMPFSSA